MAGFLAWIYAAATKVYDWFGNNYNTLRNAAANAWNWAVQQAQNALSSAKAYAHTLLQQSLSGIQLAIDWIKARLIEIRQGFIEDISAVYDWIEYKLSQISSFSVQVFWDAIDSVKTFIIDQINIVQGAIENITSQIQDWVIASFAWVLDLRDSVLQVLAIFSPTMIAKIVNFFEGTLQTILLFIANPVGFILDMIQEKFISFLCFVLAWALGTTKYDLPNTPTWKE